MLRGFMKYISLTLGKRAIVDDEDYEYLNSLGSWHFDRYAKRVTKKDGVIYMHRLLLEAPKGKTVDHINGNKLDNRRSNLRVVDHSTNCHNRHYSKNKYLGVSWDKRRAKYKAVVGFQYQRIDIGRFDTAEEARDARNRVALQLFGDNAKMA